MKKLAFLLLAALGVAAAFGNSPTDDEKTFAQAQAEILSDTTQTINKFTAEFMADCNPQLRETATRCQEQALDILTEQGQDRQDDIAMLKRVIETFTLKGKTDASALAKGLAKLAEFYSDLFDIEITPPQTPNATETSITSLSHTQLLAQNTTYATNYKYVQDHFGPAVSKTCGDIAGERAMTPDEQKAYLLSSFEDFQTVPQQWTTANKKAFLGLYYNDVSWNNASKGKIDQKFAQLMREAKFFIATENPANVPIPGAPDADASDEGVDYTF